MIALLAFLCLCLPARTETPDAQRVAAVKRLYAEQRWEEIVQVVPASLDQAAELDLYRGLALAHLQRWSEAKAAFEAGRKKEPRDKRFLLELAGVAYRRKEFSEAKAHLKQALGLDPGDAYAREFLASLYFLDGNLEAALLHWNRVGKPRITDVKRDPPPRVRAKLLDRAFAFSPLNVLRADDLRTTRAQLDNLEIFPRYQFELLPGQEDSYAVVFRSEEKNGWGDSTLEGLVGLFRGLPYQTIYPEFYNLNHSSLNIVSLLRWDAQKRRLFASLSSPLADSPRLRFRFYLDGRNENWDITETLQGATLPISDLKLKKAEAGAEIRFVFGNRWSWGSGVSFAHRSFRNFTGVGPAAVPFFTDGFSLTYHGRLGYRLLRLPERRMTLDLGASGQFGKMFARPLGRFGGVEGSVGFRWLPLPRGEDYEMNSRLRAGRMMGGVPFDELFALGVERDNDLWLRGHIGTRNGRKGRAPLGREYFLWNWEADKIVHQNAFFTVKLGPSLDVGRIADSSGSFGSNGWLWDPGIQSKVRILGRFTVLFSYGKDLRTGRNALYTTVLR